MCGRFNILASPEEIAHWFRVSPLSEGLQRRYNIAPTQNIPVVRLRSPSGHGETGLGGGATVAASPASAASSLVQSDRELEMMYWGLVPSWSKDIAMGARMINARSESAEEKPAFRNAFRRRRCLVIASGFYEWKKNAEGGKQPYLIRMHGGWMFAFAGLWEVWRPDGAKDVPPLISCTILTTTANDLLAPIHDRMPVILSPQSYDDWLRGPAGLAPDSDQYVEALKSLLIPFDAENMEAYPVSRRVNNVRNDDPDCVTPILEPHHQGAEDATARQTGEADGLLFS